MDEGKAPNFFDDYEEAVTCAKLKYGVEIPTVGSQENEKYLMRILGNAVLKRVQEIENEDDSVISLHPLLELPPQS